MPKTADFNFKFSNQYNQPLKRVTVKWKLFNESGQEIRTGVDTTTDLGMLAFKEIPVDESKPDGESFRLDYNITFPSEYQLENNIDGTNSSIRLKTEPEDAPKSSGPKAGTIFIESVEVPFRIIVQFQRPSGVIIENKSVKWKLLKKDGTLIKSATSGIDSSLVISNFKKNEIGGSDVLRLDYKIGQTEGSNPKISLSWGAKGLCLLEVKAPIDIKENEGKRAAVVRSAVPDYDADLLQNNRVDWDWLIWETEGNADPRYQRGGKSRHLGLYRLNYHKLRSKGPNTWGWEPVHQDGSLGGGKVKVCVLEDLDYSAHEKLIKTFLPCFSLDGGKLAEPTPAYLKPADKTVSSVKTSSLKVAATTARTKHADTTSNAIKVPPPHIIMPFNYDDNSDNSNVIGKDFSEAVLILAEAKKLLKKNELVRWSSASRSTIAAFPEPSSRLKDEVDPEEEWDLRPDIQGSSSSDLIQVTGPPNGKSLRQFQGENDGISYYSVKTGVDFVSTQEQGGKHKKDLLESNSVHAMTRSNIIAAVSQRLGGRFEARYQIEILSVLLERDREGKKSWDGIQIREIADAGKGEVWFPALAIPSHGKAFAENWSPGCNWQQFWVDNFAFPVGRAKAEMLVHFGLQHMTSNAQNFLIAFDRNAKGSRKKAVILRDIGDTIYHNLIFDTLREKDPDLFGKALKKERADKQDGIVLGDSDGPSIGGGYKNPRITRIGASIIFFSSPFLAGEVDIKKKPETAKILGKWCIEHNRGFLSYIQEKLSYTNDWRKGWAVPVDRNTREEIIRYSDLVADAEGDNYKNMCAKLMALGTPSRVTLRDELKQEVESFQPKSAEDANRVKRLVSAHEIVICAEVHDYLRSSQGKQKLKDLHSVS